jgi:ABC-2 type transport system permease protein
MFFASTALYPLWRLNDADHVLATVAWLNPFSHAVELIRFSLYGQFAPTSFAVVVGGTLITMALAAWRYDTGRILRKQIAAAAP